TTAAAPPAGYSTPHAPAPPAAAHNAAAAPTQTSSGPGMLAQMAATAGSVAVGSTIGHGLSSMLFGGSSSSAPAEAPAAAAPPVNQRSFEAGRCEVQAKAMMTNSSDLLDFTTCLEKADLPSCQWYLDALKACQAAAAPY
ncbi:hypothetical protein H0H93_001829, partial [Arthromyces matolae]